MTHLFRLWWDVADWPRWLRLIVLLTCMLPVAGVVASILGWSSVPGPAYAGLRSPPAMLAMGLTLALLLPALLRGIEHAPPRAALSRVLWVLAAPAFSWVIAWLSVAQGWPFLDALVRGHPIEATYTVRHVTPGGSAKCPDSLRLEGEPALFHRICHVPRETLDRLGPGVQVVIGGRGTGAWIIVREVRPLGP